MRAMFSPAIGRAARTANTFSCAPASCLLRATLDPAPQQAFRPRYQRRLSSSKPSSPPSSRKKAGVLEENASAKQVGSEPPSMGAKTKQKEASTAPPKHNIPYVPSTDHTDSAEVKMASFFGLHRPLSSLKPVIPRPTSTAEFDALFDPAHFQDAQKRQVASKVLQHTVDTLVEAMEDLRAANPDDYEMYVSAPQAREEPVYHLDRLHEHTEQSILNLASRMIPFAPPPAPTPHDKLAVQFKAITRTLAGDVDRTNTQSSFPALRAARSTPFRAHVARRRLVDSMLLISVKRQRKLKMKKHKYKKLMKKTRLLRRKLDRL